MSCILQHLAGSQRLEFDHTLIHPSRPLLIGSFLSDGATEKTNAYELYISNVQFEYICFFSVLTRLNINNVKSINYMISREVDYEVWMDFT